MINELFQSGAVYAVTGAFAGLIAGTLGVGGGLVLVPALAFIFHHNDRIPTTVVMHLAAGSSLAIMMITALSSLRAHYYLNRILWPLFFRIFPGLIIGVLLGAKMADWLSSYWLKMIFGVFLLLVSFKMYLDRNVARNDHHFPKPWIHHSFSTFVGLKSGLLGIGGGALIVPYLTYCGVDMRKIPAISVLCTVTIAVTGSLLFMYNGSNEVGLPDYAIGYVYWPAVLWVAIISSVFAPLGARWSYLLPIKHLKNAFILFLLFAAIDMLI